jgi:hypothetical protein
LSIVQHGDVCVVGSRGRVEPRHKDDHDVSEAERAEILRLLPPELLKRWDGIELNWTGGIKTEGLERDGRTSVAPVVAGPGWHGLPNAIVALPGKATLASFVADRIEADLIKLLALSRGETSFQTQTEAAAELTEADSEMHFSTIHRDLHDDR